jgi:hypothetical protein
MRFTKGRKYKNDRNRRINIRRYHWKETTGGCEKMRSPKTSEDWEKNEEEEGYKGKKKMRIIGPINEVRRDGMPEVHSSKKMGEMR